MYIKKKIVVTGGSGRFAQSLKKVKSQYKFIYPKKRQLDITNSNLIKKYLKKMRPSSILHLAGLSRPMIEHEKYDKVPKQLIVMPAFGELAGRTMNREPLKGLGPILRNGLADLSKARVETLEGLDFGELGSLIDLRL